MERKKILYFEDFKGLWDPLGRFIRPQMKDYDLVFEVGANGNLPEIVEGHGGLENISVVCTDGQLENSLGWNIMKQMRGMGYDGLAIYTGGTPLDEKHNYLYDEIINKGELNLDLVPTLKRLLKIEDGGEDEL